MNLMRCRIVDWYHWLIADHKNHLYGNCEGNENPYKFPTDGLTHPGIPPDSSLLAMVTSLDQTSNCHLRRPRTPQSTDPECTPIRIASSTCWEMKLGNIPRNHLQHWTGEVLLFSHRSPRLHSIIIHHERRFKRYWLCLGIGFLT